MPNASSGGSVVNSGSIVDNEIVDADINSAAAIAMTKIALTAKVINATRLMSGDRKSVV